MAYSGRAPKAENVTHWLVPLRHACEDAGCPAVSGPTIMALAAMPLPLVMAAVLPCGVMPLPVACHATAWPPIGSPLLSTSACAVQFTLAPAATESVVERAESVGGVPPMNSVRRLDPLVREAVTLDQKASVAVTSMVAWPSPVDVTVHLGCPQARVAFPLNTV